MVVAARILASFFVQFVRCPCYVY